MRRASWILSAVVLLNGCEPTGSIEPVADGGGTPTVLPDAGTAPQVVSLTVSPAMATVAPMGSLQLTATAHLSDGSQTMVTPTWSASAGTIDSSGAFTAPEAPATVTITATHQALSATASITVVAPGYTAVIGDDWQSYADEDSLKAAGYFWWYDQTSDPYQSVDLVQDPTFGQVVRIKFEAGRSGAVHGSADLPTPLPHVFYRFRVRFEPGFSTVGSQPAGHANSYKLAFVTWDTMNSRMQIEYSNTSQYILGASFQDPQTNQYLNGTSTQRPGSTSFGSVTTEWTDNEWWEFVMAYHRVSDTQAAFHWWRRQLTENGVVVDNAFTYEGSDESYPSGTSLPRVRNVAFGVNRNKIPDQDYFLYWGPWEVVDGSLSPNPFGLPNL